VFFFLAMAAAMSRCVEPQRVGPRSADRSRKGTCILLCRAP
jgi:hypothetical protein